MSYDLEQVGLQVGSGNRYLLIPAEMGLSEHSKTGIYSVITMHPEESW